MNWSIEGTPAPLDFDINKALIFQPASRINVAPDQIPDDFP